MRDEPVLLCGLPIVTRLFNAEIVMVPAKNYGHDLEAMLKAITPNTRIVFLANPNNPTAPFSLKRN
jgi:histidinol-phosphate aminotransferase